MIRSLTKCLSLALLATPSLMTAATNELASTQPAGVTASPTPISSTVPAASPAVTHSPSPTASPSPTPSGPELASSELKEIHGSISLPKDWSLVVGKLLEGGVVIASREKITSENDTWTTGLTMTVDPNGAGESGQPVGDYALGLAREAKEKIGEEASEISESRNGKVREFRFDYPLAGDIPLQVTEVLRADEANGVLTVILWQTPKSESESLKPLREAILSSIRS